MAGMARICAQRGCPRITDQDRCPEHRAARERQRDSYYKRSGGAEFTSLRKVWAVEVAKGNVPCGRCGIILQPDEPWHFDHDDNDRANLALATPSHPFCNTSAGGKASHRTI